MKFKESRFFYQNNKDRYEVAPIFLKIYWNDRFNHENRL